MSGNTETWAVLCTGLAESTDLRIRIGEPAFDRFRQRHDRLLKACIVGHLGEVVKLLGDGVLVRFDDAGAAIDGSLDLLAALPASGLPSAHAGVASGPLIARDGDVFGRTVNLAARIADAAPDGRLYVPEVLASTLARGRFVLTQVAGAYLPGIGGVDLVVTVGGTGVSPRAVTADATHGVLDRPIPGIAEAIRASGLAAGAVDAGLSRGLVGVSGSTLVVNLASSRAAVRDGMATLTPLISHVIAELSGMEEH